MNKDLAGVSAVWRALFGCGVAACTAYRPLFKEPPKTVLRRMMGPSLETGAVFDAVLSVNYCAIAIACLRWPSHLCVMKKAGVHPETAPIWQKRFYDFKVRTEQKQIEKLRYIH